MNGQELYNRIMDACRDGYASCNSKKLGDDNRLELSITINEPKEGWGVLSNEEKKVIHALDKLGNTLIRTVIKEPGDRFYITCDRNYIKIFEEEPVYLELIGAWMGKDGRGGHIADILRISMEHCNNSIFNDKSIMGMVLYEHLKVQLRR